MNPFSMARQPVAALAIAFAATFSSSVAANALTSDTIIDLGFVMDASGSIGATDFVKARTGLANALTQIPVEGEADFNGYTYRVGVVSFSTDADTVFVPTIVDTAAKRDALISAVLSMSYTAGFTNLFAGLELLSTLFDTAFGTDGYGMGTSSLVNVTTDGEPNRPGNAATAEASALAERDSMVAAGWDSFSVEAVGSNLDLGFLEEFASPDPVVVTSDVAAIPNPLDSGFVLQVESYDVYETAIAVKLQKIIDNPTPSPVPLPAGVWLLGTAVAGFGFASRRRMAA